jgi:hypothetical protein
MDKQEEKRKYIVFISYKSRYGGRKAKRWVGDSEQEWLTWADKWLERYMGADIYPPTEENNYNLPK